MTPAARSPVVCAIVVTYHPEPHVLRDLLESVVAQVESTVIVDNHSVGSDPLLAESLNRPSVAVIRNGDNLGLARALNQGIDWARQHAATHVLLLDQDSTPAPDMVRQLLDALEQLSTDQSVGAVGPTLVDPRSGRRAPFVRFGFPLNPAVHAGPGDVVRCDFLTTAGSLVPMSVLDRVGGMDESLFIDHVDVEWCFRAARGGYRLYGIGGATMSHRIGDRLISGTRLFVHSPERLYYIMRNRVLLYQLPQISWTWLGQDVLRIPLKFLIFAVLVPRRLQNVRAMTTGLWDGLLGRRGPRTK